VRVRFPTDEEWCAWRGPTHIAIFSAAGSRKARMWTAQNQCGVVQEIRIDKDGPEFDDAEAGMAIARVERSQVTDIQREGVNYRIEMKFLAHGSRSPADADRQGDAGTRAGVPTVVAARRSVETPRSWSPVARFMTSCTCRRGLCRRGAIVHKSAAVSEVIAQLALRATTTGIATPTPRMGRACDF